MKDVYFFDLSFICQDIHSDKEYNYYRILAGDKIFYTFMSQYDKNASDVLNKINKGERVYIGARQLSDGSYWLHWLFSEKHGSLTPQKNTWKYGVKMVVSLILLMFSICTMVLYGPTFLIILLLPGIWMFASSSQALLACHSHKMTYLLVALNKISIGDIEYLRAAGLNRTECTTQSLMNNHYRKLDSITFSDYTYTEKLSLITVKGKADCIHTVKGTTGAGKNSRSYIEYSFLCGGFPFNLRNYYNPLTENLNPLYFRSHPFFMADRDPLLLTVNKSKGTISGIYNEKDNSAYLNHSGMTVSSRQLKIIYKTMTVLFLGILIFLLSTVLFDTGSIDDGVSDIWALLLTKTKFMGDITLIFTAAFSGIMLVLEILSLLFRKCTTDGVRFIFVRQILILYRLRNGKNSVIQEID